jgi:DNA-binding MarR family transcriptional regulator
MKLKRFTREQIQVLEQLYKKNPDWEKDQIKRLAERLDLSERKVYKWNWDRQKKERKMN